MKVELGCSVNGRQSEGYIGCDILAAPGVTHQIDFERLGVNGVRLPFEDATVDDLYTAHTLEHIENVVGVLREIGRICKLGAKVEIRVPHVYSHLAMCVGHKHVVSEQQVRNWCVDFIGEWWKGCDRRLRLDRTEHVRWAPIFDAAVHAFPLLSEEQIMTFIPGTVHETRFYLTVIENEDQYRGA